MTSPTEPAAPAQGQGADPTRFSSGYRVYVTFLMAFAFALASADRGIMSILLVPIQKEFGVNDTAMGALAGTVFTVVYATAALPLARLADRGNRRNLIAAAVTVWSIMTALCGVATSIFTLALARIGVAAGEAGHGPAVMSSLGDLYPRHRRGLAFGCISVGTAIGSGLGAALVGKISDLHGWRSAFLVMGVPGLVAGALIFFTLVEPRRGAFDGGAPLVKASTWASVRYIFGISTVRRMLGALVVMQFATGAFLIWVPAFFVRVHHLTTAQMSLGFGLALSVGSALASLLVGAVTDRLSRVGERWRARYCGIGVICGAPFVLLMLLADNTPLAFIALFGAMLMAGGITAGSTVAYLSVIRSDVRGLASAMMGLVLSVVGAGLGPLVLGAANDMLKHDFGSQAVKYSLLAIPVLWITAGSLFYLAGNSADKDVAALLHEDAQRGG